MLDLDDDYEDDISDAYQKGRLAYIADIPRNAGAYPKSAVLSEAWIRGWDQRKKEVDLILGSVKRIEPDDYSIVET